MDVAGSERRYPARAMGTDETVDGRITSSRIARIGLVTAVIAATGAALAGCSSATAAPADTAVGAPVKIDSTATSRFNGAVLTTPFPLPSQTFTDTGGNHVGITAPVKGDVRLVFYGFTHCADDCPTTMADIEAALRGMPAQQQARVSLDFVTSDPWRDTPAQMRTWLDRYNTKFVGLTSDWSTIHDSGAALGIDLEKPASFAGDYQVTHGLQVLAFTSDGKAHIEWMIDHMEVEQVRHDLQLILDGTPIQ
jgi:protein SCO1/2